ncbi:MAG: hypothetical protein HUK20_09170 [Fibrobacter sp.]|nr:hypothetical protein [Fibrobacter sp.]
MPSKTMEEFLAQSRNYDINSAWMRNVSRSNKVALLFVEGKLDAGFFRSRCRNNMEIKPLGNKKKVLTIMECYEKFLSETGSDLHAFFFIDLDYDFTIQFFQKALGTGDFENYRFMRQDNLFYQIFDTDKLKGYNDLESFLFLHECFFRAVSIDYNFNRNKLYRLQWKIQRIAVQMGCFRVADRLVRISLGLPEGISLLCNRDWDGKYSGNPKEKFGAKFLVSWGLLDLRTLDSLDMDMVGEQLKYIFGNEEYGKYLDILVELAKVIYRVSEKKTFRSQFLVRGHDMTEILARCVVDHNRGNSASAGDAETESQVTKTRLEFERLLTACAADVLNEIKEYPLGKFLE